MAITRYSYRNPWRELDEITNRLGRVFNGGDFPTPSSTGSWMPAVNVEETPNELFLTAELAGMTPDDVEIDLENNILTIRGERSQERDETAEDRRYHLWERSYGSFQRSFTLPRTVDAESISADFENGLLRIRMPKAPEAKSRRIEIGSGSEGRTEVEV